jgi:hypothetical protein
MIRKLKSGQYRLYSRKKNPKTGGRRNLGTFCSRKAAEAHERAVQYFKRMGEVDAQSQPNQEKKRSQPVRKAAQTRHARASRT